MKRLIGLLFCLGTLTSLAQTLVATHQNTINRKWQYLRTDGTSLFEPTYLKLYAFSSDGYALAMKDASKKWMFIDTKKQTLELPFKRWQPAIRELGANGFHNGVARIMVKRKFGCVNTAGEVIYAPEYNFISAFVDGIAVAKIGDEVFLLDANGNAKKTSIQAKIIRRFSDGLSCFRSLEGQWGVINKQGEVVIEPIHKSLGNFSAGLAWFRNEQNMIGFLDVKGNIVFDAFYDVASNMDPVSGISRVRKDGATFYVNKAGKEIHADQANWWGTFSEGFAAIKVGSQIGFIDANGKWIVKPKYDAVKAFSDGLAAVRIGSKWGYINTTGEEVVPPTFVAIKPFENGYAIVSPKKEKWGVIDKNGKWTIEPLSGVITSVSFVKD